MAALSGLDCDDYTSTQGGGTAARLEVPTPGEVRWHLEARACTSPSVPVWCIEG